MGFGAHAEETWQKVDNKYLYGLSQQDSWRGKFAKEELEARKENAKPVSLDDLVVKVHKGLDSIPGSAASGILDEWLGKTGHKQVEDGTEDELKVLLGILRKEFRAENPKETQAEIPLGG